MTKTGQYELAAERFGDAADLNPSEARTRFWRHRAWPLSDAATVQWPATEAARRDPGTVQYALFAGRTLQSSGDVAGAQRWYQEAAKRDPRNPDVLNEVAQAMLDNGDVGSARRLLERSLSLRPDPQVSAYLKGAPAS